MKKINWTAELTFQLIKLYRLYECLWKTKSKKYSVKMKEGALNNITLELKKYDKNVNKEAVRSKIENLRKQFRVERSRIMNDIISDTGTDNTFVPKFKWYAEMDFLHDVIAMRRSSKQTLSESLENYSAIIQEVDEHNNGNQKLKSGSEDMKNCIENISVMEHPVVIKEVLEDNDNILINTDEDEDHSIIEEIYVSPIRNDAVIQENTNENRSYSHNFEQMDKKKCEKETEKNNLQFISKHEKEDEYSNFVKHIESQFRHLPINQFLILQETIQSLITRARLNITQPSFSNSTLYEYKNTLLANESDAFGRNVSNNLSRMQQSQAEIAKYLINQVIMLGLANNLTMNRSNNVPGAYGQNPNHLPSPPPYF